jgi:hypothetical protein
MARQNYFQNSFSTGEVSPLVSAQKNFDRLRNGVATMLNIVVFPLGGFTYRPGTLYQGITKALNPNVRLIPFQLNAKTAFVLEMGPLYIRFFNQDGFLENQGAIYEVSHPYTELELPFVQFIQSNDVLFFAHANHNPQKLSHFSDTNWVWEPITFTFAPLLDVNLGPITLQASSATGANITLTASAPLFAATDVGRAFRLTSGTQVGDGVITAFTSPTSVNITARNTLPTNTTTDWQLGVFSDTSGYPSTLCFYEDRLFYAGALAAPQTIYGSVVGDYFNFATGANFGDALALPLLSRSYNAIQWLLPHKVLIAGTSNAVWPVSSSNFRDIALSSETARTVEEIAYGFEPIVPVVMNKSIIAVQLGARKIREIAYSFDQDGFESQELSLLSEHITGPGIKQLCVQTLPYEILWCLRVDGVLIGLTYQKDQATCAWHRHDVGGVVNSITTIQNGAESQLWLCVTRTLHGTPIQTIERLSPFFLRNDMFDAVQLDCATKIDRIQNANLILTPLSDTYLGFTALAPTPVFLDAKVGDLIQILQTNKKGFLRPDDNFLTITNIVSDSEVIVTGKPKRLELAPNTWGLAQTQINNLEFLEGVSVQVLADGADLGQYTINQGSITLERAAYKITLGLPYKGQLATLDWEAGSALGSSEGQFGRITELNLHLIEASLAQCKVRGQNLSSSFALRSNLTHYDTAQELFSGLQTFKTAAGFDRIRQVSFEISGPLPFSCLSVMSKVQISDT